MSSSSDGEILPMVMDIGSGFLRAGFGGEEGPRLLERTIVGRPASKPDYLWQVENTKLDCYVGDKAQCGREDLSVTSPIDHGIITDWDAMETVWNYAYRRLYIKAEDQPVLISNPPLNPLGQKQKAAQMFFETFNVPGFYTCSDTILILFASGRGSGIVVDVGDGVTHVQPIFEGVALPTALKRLDVAGRDLTFHLQRLLAQKGYSFTTFPELELVRDMKEKLCFVGERINVESQSLPRSEEKSYKLPDGQTISLGTERSLCPEALFKPSLMGSESPGIHELIYDCLRDSDIDTRRLLCSSIIIAGGSTLFPSFNERLENELRALAPSRVKVVAPPERKFSNWIGGSILSSLCTFQNVQIKKEEYEEWGPNVFSRKYMSY